MRLTQQITALQPFFMCSDREIINSSDIFSHIIEVSNVLRCELLSILLCKTDSLEGLISQTYFTLIGFLNTVINKSHSLVRTADSSQASHLRVGSKHRDGSSRIDTTEGVSDQVDLWQTFLLLQLFKLLCHLSTSLLNSH